VFICSQLQYSAVFLLLVIAASHLLVHKNLLNSVLLSHIVSGGVRPKLPGQTPLGRNPPLFSAVRGSVGLRTPPSGSDRVRSTC